MNANKWQKF